MKSRIQKGARFLEHPSGGLPWLLGFVAGMLESLTDKRTMLSVSSLSSNLNIFAQVAKAWHGAAVTDADTGYTVADGFSLRRCRFFSVFLAWRRALRGTKIVPGALSDLN
jgi:hypothetical protein